MLYHDGRGRTIPESVCRTVDEIKDIVKRAKEKFSDAYYGKIREFVLVSLRVNEERQLAQKIVDLVRWCVRPDWREEDILREIKI